MQKFYLFASLVILSLVFANIQTQKPASTVNKNNKPVTTKKSAKVAKTTPASKSTKATPKKTDATKKASNKTGSTNKSTDKVQPKIISTTMSTDCKKHPILKLYTDD